MNERPSYAAINAICMAIGIAGMWIALLIWEAAR